MTLLGELYANGQGVNRDDKKALEEWAKSQGLDVNAGKAGTKALPGLIKRVQRLQNRNRRIAERYGFQICGGVVR